MGQYNPTQVPPVIDHTWLNAELALIKAAHDTHATHDFPNDCIPITAMAVDKGYSVLVLECEQSGSRTRTFVFDFNACTFIGNWYIISHTATGTPTVEITGSPVVTIAAAGTVYTSTPSTVTSLAPGEGLVMTTVTGGGTLARTTACILVKNKHER